MSGRGTVMPSALAVFRLITSSTLVDCCTGKSAGLSPSAGIDPGQAVRVVNAASIADRPAGRDEFAEFVNCWHGVAHGQRSELLAAAREEWIGADCQRSYSQAHQGREGCIESGSVLEAQREPGHPWPKHAGRGALHPRETSRKNLRQV